MGRIRKINGEDVMTEDEFAAWWQGHQGDFEELRRRLATKLQVKNFRQLALVDDEMLAAGQWMDVELVVVIRPYLTDTDSKVLVQAAGNGDVEGVASLLEKPLDPDTEGHDEDNCMDIVNGLLQAGADKDKELASLLRHGYLPWILAFWFAAMVDFQSHRYALGLSCNSWRELLIHTEGLELSTVRLLDDNMCKSSDLDCIYVAANTVEKEKRKTISVLPDKALARFQFLEAVVRLAFKRFLRAGPNHSSTEEMKKAIDALQDMLRLGEDVLEKRNSLHECLFTEECCFVYRDFQEQLRIIYEGYTSVSSYPGRRGRIISFGGWLTFCGQAMPEEPSTRLFREAFALGREVRADETSHYRHMELSWPEFLVSLGALVRLSPDFDTEPGARSDRSDRKGGKQLGAR
ncbi:unnamed protein product [Effrenium voratum]|nr:unnamed protein product [Effrenium voratum]